MDTMQLTSKLSLRDYVAYFIPGLITLEILGTIHPSLADWAERHWQLAGLVLIGLPFAIGVHESGVFWEFMRRLRSPSKRALDPALDAFGPKTAVFGSCSIFAKAREILARKYGDAELTKLGAEETFYVAWRHVQTFHHPDVEFVKERLVTLSNIVATFVPAFSAMGFWQLAVTTMRRLTGQPLPIGMETWQAVVYGLALIGCAWLSLRRFGGIRRGIAKEIARILVVTDDEPEPRQTGSRNCA
ncbi:MAG: hypothetical protein ACJ8C4_15145 [Gemmataceae bacterium]